MNSPTSPKKLGYPHNEKGQEEMRERIRERISGNKNQVSNTLSLSPEAQKRTELLEKYPQLEGKVKITNDKIIVTTTAGELTFGFTHTEGNQTFKIAKKPYTKEQLEALVELFGDQPAPYLEILGLKNTHMDDNKTYDFNFYWSSSRNDFHNAWGLFLNADVVVVGNLNRDSRCSALSSGELL